MDRKAFRNCGAVLVSLGAVLSVGCGAESVNPSTSASPRVTTKHEQRAVVVSRSSAAEDLALDAQPTDYAYDDDAVGTPIEIVAIDPDPTASPLDTVPEIQEIDATEQLEASPTEDTRDAYALDEPTSYDDADQVPTIAALEPQPATTPIAGAGETEIRFAAAGDPTDIAGSAQDGGSSDIQIVTQGSPADQVQRELTPVTITPRGLPQDEQAELDPPAVPSPLVAGQPITAAPGSPLDSIPATEEGPLVAEQPADATPPTPLPPVPVVRSAAMTAAMARVHERVRHGIQLADKGALYASRKEFTTAVKMVAQAQDVEHVTRRHTRAVINGFVALKEANDFVRQNAELGDLNIVRLVSQHKTVVLKDEDVSDMPPTIAAGYYFNYAKDQLALAVGAETNGSIALYGLGKIIVAGAGPNAQQLEYTGPAMALFQAALVSEPQNYRAAHELGVLLASSGQLEMAREMLKGSVAMSSQPLIWRNLATVHARLGEQQLAQQAQQQATVLQQADPESKAPPVEWVDPAVFATTVSATDTMVPPAAVPRAPANTDKPAPEPAKPQENVAKKRFDKWNPLNLRR